MQGEEGAEEDSSEDFEPGQREGWRFMNRDRQAQEERWVKRGR